MSRTLSRLRRTGASAAALTAVLGTTILSPITSPAYAADSVRATDVTVTVLSVDPTTPAITSTPRPLTITVSLENTTDGNLSAVSLAAERGEPIGTQAALDASLRNGDARAGGKMIRPVARPSLTLLPHQPVITTFRTTTSVLDPPTGADRDRICLCSPASVYPIDLTAQTTVGGASTVLGGTRTYLSAFDVPPAPTLGVTWIWPLIDRPHRTADGQVFTDDELAGSVANGRLDRALQVIERVESTVPSFPITLVVDPDLLDALQVMSAGRYTIRSATGTVVPGTGQQAAASWLDRLRTLIIDHSNVDIELTPLADPDITGLTQHDRSWSLNLTSGVNTSVTAALGGFAPTHTLAWPPTNSATTETLDRLTTGGVNTVVLDGSLVRPSTRSGIPVSLARVRTSTGTVNALLTAPVLQRFVQSALTGSTAALPQLSAELAVRVAQRPSVAQNVVLAAPRYVDPSPAVAAQTILTTGRSLYSSPVRADAVFGGGGVPAGTSTVRSPVASSTGLTKRQLDDVDGVADLIPAVRSLIDASSAGRQVLSTLPDVLQRAESASWSSAGSVGSVGGGPTVGATQSGALRRQLSGYLSSVFILQPKPANYTLASSTSPLPISVRNESPLTVSVHLEVRTVGGLPGFRDTDIGTRTIGPNTKVTFKVPTHIQRSGRIPVRAVLSTPNNHVLGTPVELSVHSTVLGTIGVVITIVAGVVLVLALLVRYVRRVARIRRKRPA